MDYDKYRDIRPLSPEEVPAAIEMLLANQTLKATFEALKTSMSWEQLGAFLQGCDSTDEFKRRAGYMLVKHVMKTTCSQVSFSGEEGLDPDQGYTYISNHRDIILDSAFLNVLLLEVGRRMPQVAIGDNLMLYPWVETLAKLNSSFIVRRALQGREVLLAAKQLSEYMHDAAQATISMWIAQREGRSKDSTDRTQPALLKMLAMGSGRKGILESLLQLNIVPTCCSYEYDPCDWLKAREMQLKRDLGAAYRKTKEEDGLNMHTGVFGYKGRVHMQAGRKLADLVEAIDWSSIKEADRVERLAQLIDSEIHRNYRLYSGNYVAHDWLHETDRYRDCYSDQERSTFEAYVTERLALIQMPEGIEPDYPYLRSRILEMYANPVISAARATAVAGE